MTCSALEQLTALMWHVSEWVMMLLFNSHCWCTDSTVFLLRSRYHETAARRKFCDTMHQFTVSLHSEPHMYYGNVCFCDSFGIDT